MIELTAINISALHNTQEQSFKTIRPTLNQKKASSHATNIHIQQRMQRMSNQLNTKLRKTRADDDDRKHALC